MPLFEKFLLGKLRCKILIFIRMTDEGVLLFRTMERNPFDCKFSESILYKGSPIRCFYVAHWIGEPDLIHSRWQANTNPLTPRIIASVRFAGLPSVARQYKPPRHCVPPLKRGRIKPHRCDEVLYWDIISWDLSWVQEGSLERVEDHVRWWMMYLHLVH